MRAIHLIYTVEADAQDMADRLHAYMDANKERLRYFANAFVIPQKHSVRQEWKLTINRDKLADFEQELVTNVLTQAEYDAILTEIPADWVVNSEI